MEAEDRGEARGLVLGDVVLDLGLDDVPPAEGVAMELDGLGGPSLPFP